jgi:hypothetical protein
VESAAVIKVVTSLIGAILICAATSGLFAIAEAQPSIRIGASLSFSGRRARR